MRVVVILFFIFIAPLCLSALCLAENSTNQSPAVRLGVTVPLTGDFASYGKPIRGGSNRAQSDSCVSCCVCLR